MEIVMLGLKNSMLDVFFITSSLYSSGEIKSNMMIARYRDSYTCITNVQQATLSSDTLLQCNVVHGHVVLILFSRL